MIISSINHKGGTGKTIVAQNLAVCFAHSSAKVCIIDTDESQNSTTWFSIRSKEYPRVPVFPNPNPDTIRTMIQDLYNNEGYDVIIIDSPPTLSALASRIIRSSHLVIIPVIPSGGNDIWSTEQIVQKIQDVRQDKGEAIPTYFLVNAFRSNVNMHSEFVKALEQHSKTYDIPILETRFYQRTAFGEANALGLGAYEHRDAKAKKEVIELTNEISEIYKGLN